VEQDRPQPVVGTLERADYLVTLSDRGPRAPRVVKGQDAEDLAEHRVLVRVGLDGRRDGAVAPLRKVNGRVVAQVIGDERQPHLGAGRRGPAGVGPEPEGRRRGQREGPVRGNGEGAHAHRYRPGI
jgi:hypothetical protein